MRAAQLLLTALVASSTFGFFIQVSHNNGFLPVRAHIFSLASSYTCLFWRFDHCYCFCFFVFPFFLRFV